MSAPARGSARHIGILGGGMLGLSLAWRLAGRGHRVTVLDAGAEIGGLTLHFEDSGITWDRFYHVIDGSDHALIALLEELGLGAAIEWHRTRTLFFDGRRHYPLDDAMDYLRLPALDMLSKLRVALNIVYAGARRRRGSLGDIDAARWLQRWSGRRAYQQLWAPLLRSKLGANYDKVSAAFIWAVIRRFYGARQGSRRTERFGFLPGGYARVIAALTQALEQRGATLTCNAAVNAIERADGGGLQVSGTHGTAVFDEVIVTYAAPLVARTCRVLPDAERARHAALRYQGVICLSVLLTRPLGGAYMTYITDPEVPFTTVIEMTALTGCATFGGHHLVYLPRYVPADDPLFERADEAIAGEFLAGLQRLYPDFAPAQVVTSRVARARHVLAVPVLGYGQRIPPLETSVDGLLVCNSARIVDASLSVNEAVALANATVTERYGAA